MAKILLWIIVILAFILSIVLTSNGKPLELYTKIIVLAGISVLALCESIEKNNQK